MPAVSTDLELVLILGNDRLVPVPATLSYSVAEPYAVSAVFQTTEGKVHWVFARELLAQGLLDSTGEGDVVIWPAASRERDAICLSLASPTGSALLEAPGGEVSSFLEQSYEVVPSGSETDYLDIDREIMRLLSDEPSPRR
jgi:hypothetical protein